MPKSPTTPGGPSRQHAGWPTCWSKRLHAGVLDNAHTMPAAHVPGSGARSAGWPSRWTGHDRLRQLLPGADAPPKGSSATTCGSRFQLSGSLSHGVNVAPHWWTALAVAMNVRSLTQTSSPGSHPGDPGAPDGGPLGPGGDGHRTVGASRRRPNPASKAGRSGPNVDSPAPTAPRCGARSRAARWSARRGGCVGSRPVHSPRQGERVSTRAAGSNPGMLLGGRSWYFRPHIGSEADNPTVWRPGCPRRPAIGALPLEGAPNVATAGSPCRTSTPWRDPTSCAPGSVRQRKSSARNLLSSVTTTSRMPSLISPTLPATASNSPAKPPTLPTPNSSFSAASTSWPNPLTSSPAPMSA